MVLRESKKVNEEWKNDKCSSVEYCLFKYLEDKAYKIMKTFFSKHRNKSTFLKIRNEKFIMDEAEKLKTMRKVYIKFFFFKLLRVIQAFCF